MEYTRRSITSLTELKPGDHIVVDTSTANPYGKTSSKGSSHHLLVVRAIDHTHAQVIHSVAATADGVKEERKRYSPRHVTVLEYESQYTREAAIKRAKDMHLSARVWRDSEDFVIESRTGEDKSTSKVQPKKVVAATVAAAGSGAGVGAGALIGGILGSVVPGIGTVIGATLGAAIGGAGAAGTTAIATAIAGGSGVKRACCIYIMHLYPHNFM